jgi:hypothetical protein
MWRDPLDELIAELEYQTPAPAGSCGGLMPFEELMAITDTLLYGTESAKRRLMANPDVLRRLVGFSAKRNWGPECAGEESLEDRPVRTRTGERSEPGLPRGTYSWPPLPGDSDGP